MGVIAQNFHAAATPLIIIIMILLLFIMRKNYIIIKLYKIESFKECIKNE